VNELLRYLSSTDPLNEKAVEINCVIQCIEALNNAIKSNSGLEKLCKGKFRLLTRYVMCPQFEQPVLSLLASLMANQECVADIVGMGIVPALLVVTAKGSITDVVLMCLNCLAMIASHPQVVKETIQKGNEIIVD